MSFDFVGSSGDLGARGVSTIMVLTDAFCCSRRADP